MNITQIIDSQRAFFQTGATRTLGFRRAQLHNLSAGLKKHETQLLSALVQDLGKSEFQGYSTELGLVHAELRHTLNHLSQWAAPVRGRTPWLIFPARGWVQAEPFGIALIIAPWNYPLQLLLVPLVSAIAAGNCVVIKPSEMAPHAAEAITQMLQDTFAENFVAVVNGDAQVADTLLRRRWDKIFFTGSTRVGQLVLAAAAAHLTPVTLELGGKCPAVICADANIRLAARRIAWGKFMNAGQTCVAPDFVLLPRALREPFLAALKTSLQEFYGPDPRQSRDYGRIINAQHFQRLEAFLDDGTIVHGGQRDGPSRFLAPTVLVDVSPDSRIMQEEIFGPILPLLEFEGLDDALAMLQERPTPLALYLFTGNRATERRILAQTRSGGACVNDVVAHMIGSGLPFGGLGGSGMGAYHGHAGFQAFSHHRTVVRRATWLDLPLQYPPQNLSLSRLKRALGFFLRMLSRSRNVTLLAEIEMSP